MAAQVSPGTRDDVEIRLHGQAYRMAPIDLADLIRFNAERFAEERPLLEKFQLMVDVAYESLRRNHPDIDRTFIETALDLEGTKTIARAMRQWFPQPKPWWKL